MNKNENQSFIEKYRIYLEVFGLLLFLVLVIACFLPICNGSYLDYKALVTVNPDIISEDDANKIKEEAMNTEKNITDSLDIQREVTDVLNCFLSFLKIEGYDEAYKFLDEPTYTTEDNSFKYNVEYNKGFTFFKNYLASFEYTINQVTVLDDIATCNITIKRFDINRMVTKLISEKASKGIDDSNETYESVLYEYEEYLKNEFIKSNAYMKQTDYIVGLVKVNNEWKIVNDDDLTNNIINLDFKIMKNNEN